MKKLSKAFKNFEVFASVDPSDLFMDNFEELLADAYYYKTEQEAADDGAVYVVKLEATSIQKIEVSRKLVKSNFKDFLSLQDNSF